MGWKLSLIAIDSDKEVTLGTIAKALEIKLKKELKKQPFEAVMNPPNRQLYIGRYRGTTLLCIQDKPVDFLQEECATIEKNLAEIYPYANITAFVLHSVVNFWGFSISQNGKKIRVKSGCADNGTTIDYGTALPEEKYWLEQSSIDKSTGRRIYKLEDDPDEIYEESQIGEDIVFAVAARYIGDEFEMVFNLLEDCNLQGYKFVPLKTKKWWQLW